MIITIDGAAGVGKSTTSRALAARLRFDYLDTGAMYRAVALAVLQRGEQPDDVGGVETVLTGLCVAVLPGRVLLNSVDVTDRIRMPDVSQAASKVAVLPAVRKFLAGEQRACVAGRNVVCEGRDQGTFVFPDATVKFFLIADPWVRAERRARDLAARGHLVNVANVLAEQQERDQRDGARAFAPMRPAADAILLNTTHLTIDDIVAKMEQIVLAGCARRRTGHG